MSGPPSRPGSASPNVTVDGLPGPSVASKPSCGHAIIDRAHCKEVNWMAREPKRVPLEPDTNLLRILEAVYITKSPGLLSRMESRSPWW